MFVNFICSYWNKHFSRGSWIYNYLCNQCLSLTLWVWIPFRQSVLDATLCDKVCQWLATGQLFSQGTLFLVSFTNKTDHHDTIEILLRVALSTINQTHLNYALWHFQGLLTSSKGIQYDPWYTDLWSFSKTTTRQWPLFFIWHWPLVQVI